MRRVKKRRPKSKKLQHVMIKLHDDPALDAWTEHCAGLIHAYSREVHGQDEDSHGIDSFFLHIVGDLVWSASKPAPCWSRLDVSNWVSLMVTMPGWDRNCRDSAILTVLGFYMWLVDHGHVARAEVALILCQLRILAEDTFRALAHLLPELPPDRSDRQLLN